MSNRTAYHITASLLWMVLGFALLVYALLIWVGLCDAPDGHRFLAVAAYSGGAASCELASGWHSDRAKGQR